MTLGQRLKAARLRMGLSMAHLGKRIGALNTSILLAERDQCSGVAERALAACDRPITAEEMAVCAKLGCNNPPGKARGSRRPSYCDDCRKMILRSTIETYARKSAAGKCRQCNEPRAGGVLCQKHRDERLARAAAKIRRGRCPACGKRGHLRIDHRKMGLCGRCGMPATIAHRGIQLCEKHKAIELAKTAKRQRQLELRRIESGMCFRCGKQPIGPHSTSRCEDCLTFAAADQARRAGRQERKAS